MLMLWVCSTKSQSCEQTGASINWGSLVTKNLKTDFSAVGDGITDDHEAFKDAAAFINGNVDPVSGKKGYVRLIIPDGIYIVGKQTANIGTADDINNIYLGDPVLPLHDVENVVIEGGNYTTVIYKDSMKFGTFDISTGLPPANIDEYNPAVPGSSNDSLYHYRYAGTPGSFLELINCTNIEVKNLEINGNNTNMSLGGNWGLGDRPIELRNSFGLYMHNLTNAKISNIRVHHFGGYNVNLGCSLDEDSLPLTSNIIFDSLISEYSGSNCFSWLGGEKICVLNSAFNHAGFNEIQTKPAYGMDIEPEGDTAMVCRESFFYNTVFAYNRKSAFTCGTSKDNPFPIPPIKIGYTYDHYFKQCLFVGKYESITNHIVNRVTFDSCGFFGQVLHHASSVDDKAPSRFINSYFSDCYNGDDMWPQTLLSLGASYKAEFKNNLFEKYLTFPALGNFQWIFQYDHSIYPCSTDTYKPLFEDNSFYYFPLHNPLATQYTSNSRQTKFKNNLFYKENTLMLQWGLSIPCPPSGEGNVNLGDGMQELALEEHPACSTQLVCEPTIYVSFDIDEPKDFRSLSNIFMDEDINLSSGAVSAEAADFIQLNPGFESDLSGSASIELEIGACAYGNGLKYREEPEEERLISKKSKIAENADEAIMVFPNPSNGDFTVKLNSTNNIAIPMNYEFYGSGNKLIQKGNLNSKAGSSIQLLLRARTSGLYYLRLNYGNKIVTKKLIKL